MAASSAARGTREAKRTPHRGAIPTFWLLAAVLLALLVVWPWAAQEWEVPDATSVGVSAGLAALAVTATALALRLERKATQHATEHALARLTATFAPHATARASALATAHNTLNLSLIHIGEKPRNEHTATATSSLEERTDA